MSTYYNYYIGYKTRDGKYHAYGPYDKAHKLRPALSKSRSFASELYREFSKLKIDEVDDELKKNFVYKSYWDHEETLDLYSLDIEKLPDTDFIKRGYFLTSEITEYMSNDDFKYEPWFSEHYSESEYAMKLSTAVKNNDEEELKKLKEFSFFAYPDYHSIAYDSFILSQYISYNGPFNDYEIDNFVKTCTPILPEGGILEDVVILLNIC